MILFFFREADIWMVYEPPNSPDTNILDLRWLASIQVMFHNKMPKTLPEIVQKVYIYFSTCKYVHNLVSYFIMY
jgi:hypothetical protein